MDLMEKSGLTLLDAGDRKLISRTPDPHVEVLFARPIDIPEYVANGAADLGITGHDMVAERGVDLEELLQLGIGQATLVLAVQENSRFTKVDDLKGAKIATEFPNITRSFFRERNITVQVVQVGGACEATPYLGIADAIIDLSSSGDTLRSNRMRVIEEVMKNGHGADCQQGFPYGKVRKNRGDHPCP